MLFGSFVAFFRAIFALNYTFFGGDFVLQMCCPRLKNHSAISLVASVTHASVLPQLLLLSEAPLVLLPFLFLLLCFLLLRTTRQLAQADVERRACEGKSGSLNLFLRTLTFFSLGEQWTDGQNPLQLRAANFRQEIISHHVMPKELV